MRDFAFFSARSLTRWEKGSGKTLSFGIPIVSQLLEYEEQHPGEERAHKLIALILAPTRELAIQVTQHIKAICDGSSVKVINVVGGMSKQKQDRLIAGEPQIIVATPGRFWELIGEGSEYLSDLSSLEYLVVDEADRMVEEGHYKELENIFLRIIGFVRSFARSLVRSFARSLVRSFARSLVRSFVYVADRQSRSIVMKWTARNRRSERSDKRSCSQRR